MTEHVEVAIMSKHQQDLASRLCFIQAEVAWRVQDESEKTLRNWLTENEMPLRLHTLLLLDRRNKSNQDTLPGIDLLSDLLDKSEKDLLRRYGMGDKYISILRGALARCGLKLKGD